MSTPVLVLRRPDQERIVLGGLTLVERWRRAFAALDREVEVVTLDVLRDRLRAAEEPVLVADGGGASEHAWIEELVSEGLVSEASADEAVAAREIVTLSGEGLPPAPMAVVGVDAARRLADAPDDRWGDLGTLVQDLATEDGVTVTSVAPDDPFWALPKDQREARRATWRILRRMRLRPGGLAARHVNRHFSTAMTGFLLWLPSPNWLTTLTGLFGVLAAWLMLHDGYWWGVAGAFVMQFSSILDGSDGEMSRLRYQSSEFGAWYDSVWDEIVNALFLMAVGYHLQLTVGGWWWTGIGLLAGGTSFLYALAHWHSKATRGVGLYWWFDQGKPKQEVLAEQTLMSYLKKLLWRDSFLLIYFVAAVLSILPVLLIVSAGGAAATLGLLFTHVVIKRAPW